MNTKKIKVKCRKCGHILFIDMDDKMVGKLKKTDCPSCGEESGLLWVFVGKGNYEKEKKNYMIIN